jgi:carbon monoxide dehydrogenase subunit G
MISSTKKIFINAPVEKVFAFMLDPRGLMEIWPGMQDIRNVQLQEHGGSNYDWTYKMAGMKMDGTTITTQVIPNQMARAGSRATGCGATPRRTAAPA